MNQTDYHALLSSLDRAVDILDRNRTSDPAWIAAYDTLKQARARIVNALEHTPSGVSLSCDLELAAA